MVTKNFVREYWINTAIVLSYIVDKIEYHKEKWELNWEYCFITIENFHKYLWISRNWLEPALKKLIEIGAISTKLFWTPAKKYFKLNTENILNTIMLLDKKYDEISKKEREEKNNKDVLNDTNKDVSNGATKDVLNDTSLNVLNDTNYKENKLNENKDKDSSSGNFENENTNSTTTEPTEIRTTTTADKKIKDYSEKNKKQLEDILLKIENKQSLRYVFYSHCIKRYKILVGKLNLDLLEEKIFELSKQVWDNKSFLNELIKMIDYYYESWKNIKLFSSVMVRWFDKYIANVEKE